jgi:ABC-type molybdate transport system substrate-binding protein
VLGAIYAGAVVNSAAAECSIDTPAALRKTLLAAHRIIFNRASSGRHREQLLERLNITADVANRVIRTDTGAGVIEALATDSAGADIGFAQSTEIRRLAAQGVNIRLLGLVPEALVETTVYAAAVLRHSERQPAARDFLAFLTSPPARTLLEAAGLNTGALPG